MGTASTSLQPQGLLLEKEEPTAAESTDKNSSQNMLKFKNQALDFVLAKSTALS
jgi:hypothetical protein